MNRKRKAIWDKSGGKCWYCGCDLPEKGWHADHVEPVHRETRMVPSIGRGSSGVLVSGPATKPERDTSDNLVPACAPCNLFKSTLSVEQFRREITKQADRARKSSVNFRTAERFGTVEVVEKQVVFWFEENRYG